MLFFVAYVLQTQSSQPWNVATLSLSVTCSLATIHNQNTNITMLQESREAMTLASLKTRHHLTTRSHASFALPDDCCVRCV